MQPVFRFAVNGSALRSVRLALCSQRSRTVSPCGRNRSSSLSSHSALNKYRQQRSLAISALSTCSLTSKPILLLGHVDAMLSRSSDPHRWWCSGLWIADCKRISITVLRNDKVPIDTVSFEFYFPVRYISNTSIQSHTIELMSVAVICGQVLGRKRNFRSPQLKRH